MKKFFINFREIFRYSYFKSFYVSKKAVGFLKAFKLPILIAKNTKIKISNSKINLKVEKLKFGLVKLGTPHSTLGINHNKTSYLILQNNSTLTLFDNVTIAKGFSINCFENSSLSIGNNFWANKNCTLWCKNQVTIKDNVLFGWNVYVNNFDGHDIVNKDQTIINHSAPLIIQQDVWISAFCSIIKGIEIASGSIVGYKALVTKSLLDSNCVYAGTPAKKVKENVFWKY